MPDFDFSFATGFLAILLLLVLILVIRINARLAGLERSLAGQRPVATRRGEGEPAELPVAEPSVAETTAGGAFEAFLNEDPSRRELSKNEQFKAYRKWRQENGLNWSNS